MFTLRPPYTQRDFEVVVKAKEFLGLPKHYFQPVVSLFFFKHK